MVPLVPIGEIKLIYMVEQSMTMSIKLYVDNNLIGWQNIYDIHQNLSDVHTKCSINQTLQLELLIITSQIHKSLFLETPPYS